MVFQSFYFLVFFTAVFLVYYLPIGRNTTLFQNSWLFLCSYVFYGIANVKMVPLLFGISLVFYLLGIWLKSAIKKNSVRKASYITTFGVLLGVGVLFYFKYLNFFAQSFADLFQMIGLSVSWTTLNIVLPVGVSFFTFKLISYIIEIHREHIEPCRNFLDFATYVAFFPTILSGPIDRPNKFIPQLQKRRSFDYALAIQGCRQILWGLFLKMCVADRLGAFTDFIFGFSEANSASIIFAILIYPMQMYTDFAGYSEMAIGIGKLLGFQVAINFNYPYLTTSIPSFWRAWHMSLTSWLTDYVFMPLNLKYREMGWKGSEIAIIVTFVLCGLWHGATWPFVLWGLYHGLLFFPSMASGSFFKKKKMVKNSWGLPTRENVLRIVSVYLLVAIGLVVFRSSTMSELLSIVNKLIGNFGLIPVGLGFHGKSYFFYTMGLLLLVIIKDVTDVFFPSQTRLFNHPMRVVRWGAYYVIIVLIIWLGINSDSHSSFVYFNF